MKNMSKNTWKYLDPDAMKDKICKYRKAKGLTRDQLAGQFSYFEHVISPDAIARWEQGRSMPQRDNLACLCRIYRCSISDLLVVRGQSGEGVTDTENTGVYFDRAAVQKKLKDLRLAHGFTQQELSDLFTENGNNISPAAINRWEKGTLVPSYDNMAFLCRIYGCSIDALFLTTDSEPRSSGARGPVLKDSAFLFIGYFSYLNRKKKIPGPQSGPGIVCRRKNQAAFRLLYRKLTMAMPQMTT